MHPHLAPAARAEGRGQCASNRSYTVTELSKPHTSHDNFQDPTLVTRINRAPMMYDSNRPIPHVPLHVPRTTYQPAVVRLRGLSLYYVPR